MTTYSTESEVVDAAVAMLQQLLPASWTVTTNPAESFALPSGAAPIPSRPGRFDGVLQIQSQSGGFGQLVIEARTSFAPRDVAEMLRGINSVYRRQGPGGLIVIAPQLSARSRDLLSAAGVHYIDLTGQIRIRIDSPPLFLERDVATDTNRVTSPATSTQLRGPRAGRIVRVLIDAAPPYRVKDVAMAAEVSLGYVSKALEALDAEALVQRGRRGEVLDCDWAALLRRWATASSMMTGERALQFIAPAGIEQAADALGALTSRWVISGSFGATSLAAVTAPSLLVVYTDDPDEFATSASLLATTKAADILVVQPTDPVVYARRWRNDRYFVAAPSQLAADCLNGPGRMPAEGEELIRWMTENEPTWRAANLAALSANDLGPDLPARPLFR